MKKIKFLVFTFTALVLTSCSLDDDESNFHFEAMSITEVDLPESFVYGETYDFNITYEKPSSCYVFQGFDYVHSGNLERTVTAVASVYDDRACTEGITFETKILPFEVRFKGTYTFRFWTGINEETQQDEYIIVEIPVEEEQTTAIKP
ncbi:hypothetical protein SAMN04487906_0379 [Zhouia amylolytica]|uniref:Lipoprotein n=2 Tax=Zhouia amylolytica TaxID=376730 RepID=W2UJJ0_9FLAO|nr:hypothetical protein [Zhouia amylolytica]ETN94134.1 hypothetical protein P278_29380 [Zhouia amylolytica AD3]MCQ0112357.1 hypothetical protein [Zhouia amylolytica]SFS41347.1 hypothetical protein SAMN04487906_0379 [Zhouia amylolytica]